MEGKIYRAIADVMRDIGAVGKDAVNGNDGYKYRSIDAVMNALNPAMVKNGVIAVPKVIESRREERAKKDGSGLIFSVVKVSYTFYAEDGSSVETIVIGEAMDDGDKSMNKAMSAAYKYACFQTFCIPTGELLDSEKDSQKAVAKVSSIADHLPETKTERMHNTAESAFERILQSGLFKDDEIFLIGSKQVKNRRFAEVKKTKAFLVFLNFCATADMKFEDPRMQEQFLRCKALAAQVMEPGAKAA